MQDKPTYPASLPLVGYSQNGPTSVYRRAVRASPALGAQIARRLIAETDCTILARVRAQDSSAAAGRLERAWWDWPELVAAIDTRVEPVAGDVCLPGLGLDQAGLDELMHRLTHAIHDAAELRLEAPLEELRHNNMLGTRNVLQVARAANQDHGFTVSLTYRRDRCAALGADESTKHRSATSMASRRGTSKARMPKDYTFHRLRHDYASILLKQSVKNRTTQEMLRHAQYSTTASIYQHVSSDDHFAAAQAAQDGFDRALRA